MAGWVDEDVDEDENVNVNVDIAVYEIVDRSVHRSGEDD